MAKTPQIFKEGKNDVGQLTELGWKVYLEKSIGHLVNGPSKDVNFNQLNHFGSNIVKNESNRVSLAQTLLAAQKAKKGLGLKPKDHTAAEKALLA